MTTALPLGACRDHYAPCRRRSRGLARALPNGRVAPSCCIPAQSPLPLLLDLPPRRRSYAVPAAPQKPSAGSYLDTHPATDIQAPLSDGVCAYNHIGRQTTNGNPWSPVPHLISHTHSHERGRPLVFRDASRQSHKAHAAS